MTTRRHSRIYMAAAALLASIPAFADMPPTPGQPAQRIVSSNLCADRLVLQLADRDHILSVSRFAADPASSTVADAAAAIPANQGNAEGIFSYHPDIVVLGSFNSRLTASMLRALGVKVHILPTSQSIEQAKAAIRSLAVDLGVPERGERLITSMEARLAALPVRAQPIRAAVYQAGGWTSGRGTMADEMFQRLGFTNIAAEAGVNGFGALPLETLVADKPDLIVFETMGDDGPPSIAGELLRHPALSQIIARVAVPMKLWACPDPALVDAAALIAGAAP